MSTSDFLCAASVSADTKAANMSCLTRHDGHGACPSQMLCPRAATSPQKETAMSDLVSAHKRRRPCLSTSNFLIAAFVSADTTVKGLVLRRCA